MTTPITAEQRQQVRAEVCTEEGHRRIDITGLADPERQLMCGRCGHRWSEPHPGQLMVTATIDGTERQARLHVEHEGGLTRWRVIAFSLDRPPFELGDQRELALRYNASSYTGTAACTNVHKIATGSGWSALFSGIGELAEVAR